MANCYYKHNWRDKWLDTAHRWRRGRQSWLAFSCFPSPLHFTSLWNIIFRARPIYAHIVVKFESSRVPIMIARARHCWVSNSYNFILSMSKRGHSRWALGTREEGKFGGTIQRELDGGWNKELRVSGCCCHCSLCCYAIICPLTRVNDKIWQNDAQWKWKWKFAQTEH